jgi:hypothetical protein
MQDTNIIDNANKVYIPCIRYGYGSMVRDNVYNLGTWVQMQAKRERECGCVYNNILGNKSIIQTGGGGHR